MAPFASSGTTVASGVSAEQSLIRWTDSPGERSLASFRTLVLQDDGPSVHFSLADRTLRRIHELVAPHTGQTGIFKRVAPCLSELEMLITSLSKVYQACRGGTTRECVIRKAIGIRMEQCNNVLYRLLGELIRLPYRSFPRTGAACCVVYEWWTRNEPEDIRAIRAKVCKEVMAIAESLHHLNSYVPATSLASTC